MLLLYMCNDISYPVQESLIHTRLAAEEDRARRISDDTVAIQAALGRHTSGQPHDAATITCDTGPQVV